MTTKPRPGARNWLVHFETVEGEHDWINERARHPAGAKRAAMSELRELNIGVRRIYWVTRSEATQNRWRLRFRNSDPLGQLFRGLATVLDPQDGDRP
jgi:hypothetical protein